MADAAGLNPAAARHVGSNPAPGTMAQDEVREERLVLEGWAPGAGARAGTHAVTQSLGRRVEHLSWVRRPALAAGLYQPQADPCDSYDATVCKVFDPVRAPAVRPRKASMTVRIRGTA